MAKEKRPKKVKPFDLDVFLERELRRAFKRSPMYSDCKRRAKEDFFVESKHGKLMRRTHFKCADCKEFFFDKKGLREIVVDHIDPVVPVDRPVKDRGEWVNRLFCSVDNLQILCKPCHKLKTKHENEQRSAARAS